MNDNVQPGYCDFCGEKLPKQEGLFALYCTECGGQHQSTVGFPDPPELIHPIK